MTKEEILFMLQVILINETFYNKNIKTKNKFYFLINFFKIKQNLLLKQINLINIEGFKG